MALVMKVEVVAAPNLPPGYRNVNGYIKGPTDETYPPGTGGPMPVQKFSYAKTKITTVRDTNSGHIATHREVYAPGAVDAALAESERRAVARAESRPGTPFVVGLPKIVSQAEADAVMAALKAPRIEAESEKAPAEAEAEPEDAAKAEAAANAARVRADVARARTGK